jgi:protein-S-isoprenylcysteine O-methyltransferase Ste14
MKNTILIPPFFVLLGIIFSISMYYLLPDEHIIAFPWNLSGIILLFLGFALVGKTNELFKKYKTTHAFEDATGLVTESIFCRTRNPIYCGMIIFLLGIAVCFCTIYSFLIPPAFFILLNIVYIPYEEKALTAIFDEKYINYKHNVRRWI